MYKTIVVGTDGSPTARAAVCHAAGLARLAGASLHVVSAKSAPPMVSSPEFVATGFDANAVTEEVTKAALEEAASEARALGVTAQLHDPLGSPAKCLVEMAEEVAADLIVVGSRGMHGKRRVLGSIPNTVTHQAPCHVLVVQTA